MNPFMGRLGLSRSTGFFPAGDMGGDMTDPTGWQRDGRRLAMLWRRGKLIGQFLAEKDSWFIYQSNEGYVDTYFDTETGISQ